MPQRCKIIGGRQLRPVTIGGDKAKKAKRRILSRAELMPLHGMDFHQIMLGDVGDPITNQASTAATQDQHPMDMFMAFQRGMTAGLHFKIPPLNGE